MMLLDSNIIIYSVQLQHEKVRATLLGLELAASAISVVEVLGYHHLAQAEKILFEALFAGIYLFPIGDAVILKAAALQQRRKMSLGDAIIAATALDQGLTLITRNVGDFALIPSLEVFNPLG